LQDEFKHLLFTLTTGVDPEFRGRNTKFGTTRARKAIEVSLERYHRKFPTEHWWYKYDDRCWSLLFSYVHSSPTGLRLTFFWRRLHV